MKRILVIEDEPQMLLGLRDNLELEGYEVQTASDGEQGLVRAAAFNPDLVILDLMLPEIDGLIAEHPDDPYFLELKGQILYESGRAVPALQPVSDAHRRVREEIAALPDAPSVHDVVVAFERIRMSVECQKGLDPGRRRLSLSYLDAILRKLAS